MIRVDDNAATASVRAEELLVGLGSPHGDDRVGWMAVDAIEACGPWPRRTIRKASSPLDILDWLDGQQTLTICDACRGAGRVGSVHRWQWPSEELDNTQWSGSHDFPLVGALELASRLSKLPPRVILWGMELPLQDDTPSSAATKCVSVLVKAITAEWAEADQHA